MRTELLDLTDDYTDDRDTTLGRVVSKLREKGVDARVVRYRGGQCSCCYWPEFESGLDARVMVPVNEAENQAVAKPKVFWSRGERVDGPVQYLSFEDDRGPDYQTELGHQIAAAFHEAGLMVFWGGDPGRSIQVGLKPPDDAPTYVPVPAP